MEIPDGVPLSLVSSENGLLVERSPKGRRESIAMDRAVAPEASCWSLSGFGGEGSCFQNVKSGKLGL